ncbi:MAG TPA: metallophosphoesterase [Thermomicrobiaceae bacterium]|nr:metallophosphoesterase [Thermomicrobiaceae bacterium]
MIRLAAIADIHARPGGESTLREMLERAQANADVLVIAGDLTDSGLEEEARVLAAVIDAGIALPIVAVLGNHDFHHNQNAGIHRVLSECGVAVLDGDCWTCEHGGVRLGIGGCVGFGGGFRPYNLEAFGEPEWKTLYDKIVEEGRKLDRALAGVHDADYIVAVTHYSPTVDTMGDEPPALHPYLGSSELGEAIERHDVLFAIHGHAHRGRREGCTDRGTPVFNVSMPIVTQPLIWSLEPRGARHAEQKGEPTLVAPDGVAR